MASLTRRIITYSDGSYTVHAGERTIKTSPEWTRDHESRQNSIEFCMGDMKDCGAVVGLPDQMAMYYDEFIPLTKKLQFFWFDLCCFSRFGKLHDQLSADQLNSAKTWWRTYTDSGRCWNNGCGWDSGYQDYVLGKHTDPTKGPIQYENVFLSRNPVDVISDSVVVKNANYLKQGAQNYDHLRVRCINLAQLDSRLPPVTDPVSVRMPYILEVFHDDKVCHKLTTTVKPDKTLGMFPQWDRMGVYLLARGKANETLIRKDLING